MSYIDELCSVKEINYIINKLNLIPDAGYGKINPINVCNFVPPNCVYEIYLKKPSVFIRLFDNFIAEHITNKCTEYMVSISFTPYYLYIFNIYKEYNVCRFLNDNDYNSKGDRNRNLQFIYNICTYLLGSVDIEYQYCLI